MKFLKWLISFIFKGLDDDIMVYAAQSAYYLVLSSIPFTMILLSVVQYFIPLDKSDVLKILPTLMSPSLQAFIADIIDEIFSKPMISLISVSAVTTLWSASRGFAAMERGIKVVYRIPKRKFFIIDIMLSLIYTVLFIAILLLSLGVIVFGKTIIYVLESHIPWFTININLFQYVLCFALIFLFFTVIYASFSSRKIPFRYHIPGALFTGAGWILFSFIFSIYINNFSNYSRIYGSLTAIVLLMLWIYCCMTILLYGAEINMEIITHKGIDYRETKPKQERKLKK